MYICIGNDIDSFNIYISSVCTIYIYSVSVKSFLLILFLYLYSASCLFCVCFSGL